MSEEQEEKKSSLPAKNWLEVETLRGTRFGSLLVDLRELEKEKDDLEERISAVRSLIEPFVQNLPFPVRALDQQASWTPETETWKLDEKLLVKAGVTPDQIKAGKRKGKKKAYLTVRPVNAESDTSNSSVEQSSGFVAPILTNVT